MARGRRGGGMGARRPAPARRPASTAAAPPKPAPPAPAPAQAAPVQQSGGGGGMLSGIGSTIAQGMAFGTGSAIAHQAVGAAVGAMSGGSSSSGDQVAAAAPVAQPSLDAGSAGTGVCANDKQIFFDCLKANNGDAQSCSFLYEQLQQCQQQSSNQTFY